ncbi:MAG TPA: metallophosphoesterase [Noviherbaspirillum sp.]|uniref:metallophosphoesterase n=1 Tax=Noviherbaspirillum sp. TaxID=1926288 RepID=UPI002B47DC3E|nr:metallophosphoesterase [Noviherbaspirillum sp.]HJV87441.1 metallophosphoesterase [Noviherbaspirillum sp.]
MKIQIASDLHLEFLTRRFPDYRVVEPTDADLLVIAGDIHKGNRAIEAFRNWPIPVLYVHGNHEAYHHDYLEMVKSLREGAEGTKVRFLECDEHVQGGVRFLGCCLWTDYQLYSGRKEESMAEAERILIDHELIKLNGNFFLPRDAEALHLTSRAWLEKKLQERFDGTTIVVTHHAPHRASIHPRFADSPLNPSFISDLGPLLEQADIWIHGHVHDSFDYRVGKTRVIANPRGYTLNRSSAQSPEELQWENPGFDPRMVIEV